MVGKFRGLEYQIESEPVPSSSPPQSSDREGAEDTATFARYMNTLPSWLAEDVWTITLYFMGLRTLWTDWHIATLQ